MLKLNIQKFKFLVFLVLFELRNISILNVQSSKVNSSRVVSFSPLEPEVPFAPLVLAPAPQEHLLVKVCSGHGMCHSHVQEGAGRIHALGKEPHLQPHSSGKGKD
jgi:hypothetical protein